MFCQTITYKHKQMSKQLKDNFSTCFYNKKKILEFLTVNNNNNKKQQLNFESDQISSLRTN